jgi:hypothetical protein
LLYSRAGAGAAGSGAGSKFFPEPEPHKNDAASQHCKNEIMYNEGVYYKIRYKKEILYDKEIYYKIRYRGEIMENKEVYYKIRHIEEIMYKRCLVQNQTPRGITQAQSPPPAPSFFKIVFYSGRDASNPEILFIIHSYCSCRPSGNCGGSWDRTRNCCVAVWCHPVALDN